MRPVLPLVVLVTALQPISRADHGRFCLRMGKAVLAALVESHNDVRAEIFLHLHGLFGRKKVLAAVDIGGKLHARVGDFVELRQGKHLKAAAVRENGPVPIHEGVQAARLFHQLVAGAHVKVVGVGQNNLRARFFEIARKDALYGRLRADGHIDGGFYIPVGRVQNACARARFGVGFYQLKREKFVVHNP